MDSRPVQLAAGRMRQLDGLRALAVVAVLVHHTVGAWGFWDLGTLGVNLFFVLSGFLIGKILLDSRDRAAAAGRPAAAVLAAFYARRVLRIFPPYYLALGLGLVAGLPHVRDDLAWHLAYLTNVRIALNGDFIGQPVNHLWTLAVEEQFYLLLPAAVLFAPRRWLPGAIGLAVLAAPLARVLLATVTKSWETSTVLCFSNFDVLGAGVLLALVRSGWVTSARWARVRRAHLWALGFGLMALNLALFTAGAGWRVRIGLNTFSQMLVFVCLIDRASFGFGGVAGRVLEARPVVYVGTISYGLYLYHEFVPPAVRRLSDAWSLDWGLPPHGWLRFLVVGLVTLGVAALSWHLFERPLTGLKRYIPYVGRARPRRAAGPAGLVTAAFHEA